MPKQCAVRSRSLWWDRLRPSAPPPLRCRESRALTINTRPSRLSRHLIGSAGTPCLLWCRHCPSEEIYTFATDILYSSHLMLSQETVLVVESIICENTNSCSQDKTHLPQRRSLHYCRSAEHLVTRSEVMPRPTTQGLARLMSLGDLGHPKLRAFGHAVCGDANCGLDFLGC